MTARIQVTVLVENTTDRPGLLAEHGLAYYIDTRSQGVLFDTGQGNVLAGNAYRLGIPLSRVETVVLSHGHYDHTGGLADVLRGSRSISVIAHPAALQPKFARNQDGTSREIGMPLESLQALQRRREQCVLTEKPTRVAPGITVTGPVPRVTEYEDTGGPFYLDTHCQQSDPLSDDQAVFFETSRGTVVLLGCAHAGVINTLRYVRELTDQRPIHAVLGGMHLVEASTRRLQQTIDELRALKLACIGPAHCTGRTATAALWNALPNQCLPCNVGTQLEFDLAETAS